MKHIGSITMSAAIFMAFSSMAQAAPFTLDFDYSRCGEVQCGYSPDYARQEAVVKEALDAGVEYYDQNWLSYGALQDRLTTGNDGFYSKASFNAQPGKVFSALTVDIENVTSEIWSVSCDGVSTVRAPWWVSDVDEVPCDDPRASDSVQYELPSTPVADFLEVVGYRDGVETISLRLEPTANSILKFADLGDFTNLTRLDLGVIFVGFWPVFRPDQNAWEYCEGGRRCGFIEYDNLVLDIINTPTASPAPVPLPAGALLLSAALGCLARAARRKTA